MCRETRTPAAPEAAAPEAAGLERTADLAPDEDDHRDELVSWVADDPTDGASSTHDTDGDEDVLDR